MIGHPAPGQTPERHALDLAEVASRVRIAVIAGQRAGLTRLAVSQLFFDEWQAIERLQTSAATEAGKSAARRRGPRRQKGVR